MTTDFRTDLRKLIRRRLGDLETPYTFSDEQINQWINDAIADYSMHFPLTKTQTISCTANIRNYDLATDFIFALKVEFPVGEDPPQYLYFREKTHPEFWQVNGYYFEEKEIGDNDLDIIYISQKPTAAQSIKVTYHSRHAFLDNDDTDEVTVPEEHLELMILFVRWASYQELAATESASPDPTTTMSSSLELNANWAEIAYHKMLSTDKESASTSAIIQWEMDRYKQIYY